MRAVFPIRLSIGEKLKLCKAAVLRGLSPSTYVRTAALEQAERDLAAQSDFPRQEPEESVSRFSRGNLAAGPRSKTSERPPPPGG
jgi:hypothetical protein